MRGPAILPRVPGRPETPTRADRFDAMVLASVSGIEDRWRERLGLVEYAVEDAPQVGADWGSSPVPLSALVHASGATPARVVLFRRPLELRAEDREDLRALVHAVLVEQVAVLLGLPPQDVDPHYADDPPDQ
ncbi:conserved hypothetical protein [Nocardioides sp. AX2bis]|nr:conserved hypothetical protein [Nocardioides sp. AX2bis]